MLADLHFHSIYSDGALSLEKLVERALRLGVKGVCLTDHDSIEGQEKFAAMAKSAGLTALAGVELSTFDETEVHILGYNFDARQGGIMQAGLKGFGDNRYLRTIEILKKLRALNINIDLSDLQKITAGSFSRVHIAAVLMQKRIVKSIQEAMDIYLGEGKLAWVDFYRKPPLDALRIILEGGGVPVLAHPGRIAMPEEKLQKLIEMLCENGLKGIETYYPAHTKNTVEFCRKIAKRLGLVCTTGSDYHSGAFVTPPPPFSFELEEDAYKLLF